MFESEDLGVGFLKNSACPTLWRRVPRFGDNPLSLTDPSGYRSLSANLELYWKPVAAIAIIVVTGGQAAAAMSAAATASTAATAASVAAAVLPGTAGALASTAAAGFTAAAASATTSALGWAVAGGALAGAVTTGTLRGAVTGAVDGAFTFGIGQSFKSLGSLTIAHSMKGGLIEAMNGGDFGHGMLGAGLSKITGVGVAKLDSLGTGGQIVVQALAGGTVSAATGGGFANGAASAALQYVFNACVDGICDGSKEQFAYNWVPGYKAGTCISNGFSCTGWEVFDAATLGVGGALKVGGRLISKIPWFGLGAEADAAYSATKVSQQILSEVGSKVLPDATYAAVSTLSKVEAAKVLVQSQGAMAAAVPRYFGFASFTPRMLATGSTSGARLYTWYFVQPITYNSSRAASWTYEKIQSCLAD